MKFNLEMAIAGVALFAIAYQLGKRGAAAAAVTAKPAAADSQAQWWTYAGGWSGAV